MKETLVKSHVFRLLIRFQTTLQYWRRYVSLYLLCGTDILLKISFSVDLLLKSIVNSDSFSFSILISERLRDVALGKRA